MRAEIRRQSVAEVAPHFSTLCTMAHDHKSCASIDFEVTNSFYRGDEFANKLSVDNEDRL